mgnify:CR=1 FL=1
MLTIKDFSEIQNKKIFSSGKTKIDHPMKKGKVKMKWLAIKNGNNWSIKIGTECEHSDVIAMYGEVIKDEATIRKLVPCDNVVYGLYY